MPKNLVIVESPAKAKKIGEYLGSSYQVEASIGHIRDLPEKNIGIDIASGFIPEYEITADKKKRVSELRKYAKNAENIILATDPDREGEAIAWHLAHVFDLDPREATRVTYHEITKSAIEEAFREPRKIDMGLVNAQQSRRILDRIVGYEVSPVLWRKVRSGLSAGRVQSVAVKLLVEREREIRAFHPEESWKIDAGLTSGSTPFSVELSKIGGKSRKLSKEDETLEFFRNHGILKGDTLSKKDKKGALLYEFPHEESFTLFEIEKKESKRSPGAPFTTSTLQQEASRKLGYGVKQTMDITQRLYQNGFITYMRTDSVNLSEAAISSIRTFIVTSFGGEYAVSLGRKFKTKQANAQEAHEAIRPTDIACTPESSGLDGQEARIYRLIWERTLASQMAEAIVETTTYRFHSEKKEEEWIARGEVIQFPGFMKLYVEGNDDEEDEESKKLPALKEGVVLTSHTFSGLQKFSLPPPRYTEASLVKKLESEGIGRPSTYAPTIQTIQDRGYVVIESKKLIPTDIAFVVTDFLEKEFSNFMDYGFTAEVESQFDAISEGKMEWQKMLGDFYTPFHEKIENALGTEGKFSGERILGKDPKSGRTLLVRMSRFGPVVQIGTSDELDPEEKPRYANLAPGQSIDDITSEEALKLFSLPKDLGMHDGMGLVVGQGRYGPYIKHGESFISIPRSIDPLSVDLEKALEIIALKNEENKPLGEHEGLPITKGKGRFGPYLKWNGLYVNVPRAIDFDAISLDEATALIEKKKEKEATRYILRFEAEGIDIENGRYGPFIKYKKKNFYLKKGGKKITELPYIEKLSLDEVKDMIEEQLPGTFTKGKKGKKK